MLDVFERIVQKRKAAQIVCVGDVMLDRYVHGQAHRISPEAPIPILNYSHSRYNPGGAANVAANLSALGARVSLFGRIGTDQAASDLQTALSQFQTVSTHWLHDDRIPTTEKTRFVVGGQQLLRMDHELKSPVSVQQANDFLPKVKTTLEAADVLILSDYAKGMLPFEFCQALIESAIEVGVPVMVDPKGTDFGKYKGASLLTPNLAELRAAVGQDVSGDAQVVAAATSLMRQFDIQALLVTRSAEGMTLVSSAHPEGLHIHSTARDVSDVSGAGDTVIAALAVGIACGLTPAESANIANMAAGVSVARHGTVQVTLEEVKKEIEASLSLPQTASVLFSNTRSLNQQVKQWQLEGLSVGFTNGCFDLLHAGHLHSLANAKKQCNKLVVALNSDESVKALKGPHRPVQDQHTRAQVLCALRMVDAVVVFNEDTPAKLIEMLLPNVMFKGADYRNKEVAGAKAVLDAGGKVVLIDLLEGHSTTTTVKKLNKGL